MQLVAWNTTPWTPSLVLLSSLLYFFSIVNAIDCFGACRLVAVHILHLKTLLCMEWSCTENISKSVEKTCTGSVYSTDPSMRHASYTDLNSSPREASMATSFCGLAFSVRQAPAIVTVDRHRWPVGLHKTTPIIRTGGSLPNLTLFMSVFRLISLRFFLGLSYPLLSVQFDLEWLMITLQD